MSALTDAAQNVGNAIKTIWTALKGWWESLTPTQRSFINGYALGAFTVRILTWAF
ncbi:MAG: hypothetical protein IPM64_17425 [Phycisphaerales bacterium]|nr:hypothetical protein [Phycisphaerales bacterium]